MAEKEFDLMLHSSLLGQSTKWIGFEYGGKYYRGSLELIASDYVRNMQNYKDFQDYLDKYYPAYTIKKL